MTLVVEFFCVYVSYFMVLIFLFSGYFYQLLLNRVDSRQSQMCIPSLPCIMQVRDGSPNARDRHISTQEGLDGPRMDGRVRHGPEQVKDALSLGCG